MENLEARVFFGSIEPFNSLEISELNELISKTDIEYFKKDSLILKNGDKVESYYLIIKGFVVEEDEKERIYYGVKDSFCANSLLKNVVKNDFVAGEECIVFTIKREDFLELFYKRENFKKYYLNSFSSRIKELAKSKQNADMAIFSSSKIKDIYTQKPIIVPCSMSIIEGVKLMSKHNSDCLIVDFEGSFGIITNTNLRQKVILESVDTKNQIGDITVRNLISIDEDDFMFNALVLMQEFSITRLAVKSNGKIVGILEQADLLSSENTHLLNTRVLKAENLSDLKNSVLNIEKLIKALYLRGLSATNIAKIVSDLNYKIHKRLFELIMPKKLIENSVLMVMGSEGRKEQIIRTDQDNGLILKDGFKIEGLDELMAEFVRNLVDFGYPLCSGNTMVSNPYFCKSLSEYKSDMLNFVQSPSSQNSINFAIFIDASFVVGDSEIFDEFKSAIYEISSRNSGFYPHFAKAILNYETPLSFFSNFSTKKDMLDIKKGAIFPFVHSIRSLSLEMGITHTNTIERIKALEKNGYF
ncbi:MAG: CBS domain-containing protein, partial [Campylobacter sp.]|nr:CBS domain-containing protein [Campylobacter sp.]